MSNDEILDFLNKNTVNIFLYDNMPGRGLSSTIDYAVSVDTPLIVNNSNMFRHLLSDRPRFLLKTTQLMIYLIWELNLCDILEKNGVMTK